MYRGCSCFCGVLIALVNYGGGAQHPIVSQHVPPWYDGTSRKPQTRLKYAVALSLPIWKQVFTCLTFEVFSIFFRVLDKIGQKYLKIIFFCLILGITPRPMLIFSKNLPSLKIGAYRLVLIKKLRVISLGWLG